MMTSADCALLTVVESSISKLYNFSPASQLPTALVVTSTGFTLISVISFGAREDDEDEEDEGEEEDESDEVDELDSEDDEPDEFEDDEALDSDDEADDEPEDEPEDEPLDSEDDDTDEVDGLDSDDRLEGDWEPSPDKEDSLEPSVDVRLGDSLGAGPPGIRHRRRAVLPSSMEQVNTTTSPGLTSIILCKFTVSDG
jgi:hypothetical protein